VPAGKCTYNGGVLQTSDMQQPCNFHFLLTANVHLQFLVDLGCASLSGGERVERGEKCTRLCWLMVLVRRVRVGVDG
jgi:hypothetical protein